MERILKFRGRNIHTGEWFYGNLEYNRVKEIARIHSYDNDGNYIGQNIVDPSTLGQFVGITDEHGNEVFEGDVLEADYKYDRLGYNGGVDPDNDCVC